MSTYESNRAKQRRLRGSNEGTPIRDRVGAFIRAATSVLPTTAPFALPFTYGRGMLDAAAEAQKRGSRISGLPELGLSEAVGSFGEQLGSDLKTAFAQTSLDNSTIPVVKPPMPSDNTLGGQYQRYFKTPEFDGVFGAGARGTGAPEDAAAMEVLGNQIEAPEEDTNIASMYAAQSAMGRVNQDKIQDYFADTNLPGNVKLKDGRTALQAWAKANPMLAQREYLKAEAKRAENAPMAPDGETMLRDLGGSAQYENPMGKEAYDAITAAREKLMKKAGSK